MDIKVIDSRRVPGEWEREAATRQSPALLTMWASLPDGWGSHRDILWTRS